MSTNTAIAAVAIDRRRSQERRRPEDVIAMKKALLPSPPLTAIAA